jgi:hypothetical protein
MLNQSALEYLAIVTGRRAADFGPGDRALMEKHLCKLRYGSGREEWEGWEGRGGRERREGGW